MKAVSSLPAVAALARLRDKYLILPALAARIDWLTAVQVECDRRVACAGPDDDDDDHDAALVRTLPLTFDDFAAVCLGRLRQHAASEATVTSAALQALDRLAADATAPANRLCVFAQRAARERSAPC